MFKNLQDNEDSDGKVSDGENISNRNSRRTISDDDEPARKSKGKAKKPVQVSHWLFSFYRYRSESRIFSLKLLENVT